MNTIAKLIITGASIFAISKAVKADTVVEVYLKSDYKSATRVFPELAKDLSHFPKRPVNLSVRRGEYIGSFDKDVTEEMKLTGYNGVYGNLYRVKRNGRYYMVGQHESNFKKK